MTVPGILLTGGASRRMGTDKATLVVDGEPLAVRVARVVAEVCDPLIEVGPGVTVLPTVREHPPGAGPLAAVLAGVDVLGTPDAVLVCACDLPFVTADTVRLLAEHPAPGSVVPRVAGRDQYACARWSAAAIGAARDGEALRDLLRAGDATFIDIEDSRVLADVDTPDDLRRLGLS